MSWVVPNEDAITLGEMNGELIHITKQDEFHLGDVFLRQGGNVYLPARMTRTSFTPPHHQRESLYQQQSLTPNMNENDHQAPKALQLVRKMMSSAKTLMCEDELIVLQSVLHGIKNIIKRTLTSGQKKQDEEEEMEITNMLASTNNSKTRHIIVSMDWHPNLSVLAVARHDGDIALYDLKTGTWDPRVLEHPLQTDITHIEWAKYTGGNLAVACRGGIFLWKCNLKNKHADPVLVAIYQNLITSNGSQLSWNEDGSMFAVFSKNCKSVVIVDVCTSKRSQLQSSEYISHIKWAPSGDYLFAALQNGTSVIWETCLWKKETWEVNCTASGWSPDGKCLLVAEGNRSVLLPYLFRGAPPSIDVQINSPAIDFEEKQVFSLDRSYSQRVGGNITSIVWDPSGTRVAVTYSSINHHNSKATGAEGNLVAIFTVAWEPFLIFTRSGLIRGPKDAGVPSQIKFCSHFDGGALLSVAWSNGLVTFYPFYFE